MKSKLILLLLLVSATFTACSDNDDNSSKSSRKELYSFSVGDREASIYYNGGHIYIDLVLPMGSSLTAVKPVIQVSDFATVSPGSEVEQDFTEPVIYTVRAQDGSTQEYIVEITVQKSELARIHSFSIDGVKGKITDKWTTEGKIQSGHILIWLKGVTDVTQLKPVIEISEGATISPQSGETVDFSKPVQYTITAPNGNKKQYTVGVQYDTYPSGLQYLTSFRSGGIFYQFMHDYLRRLRSFSSTSNPFYNEDRLIEGNLVHVSYDSEGAITQLELEERENYEAKSIQRLTVSYPTGTTVQLTDGLGRKDVITLDSEKRVVKFDTGTQTESYEYDALGNLTKWITDEGYQVMTYDNYNSTFGCFNAPQWMLLYTTGILLDSGANNVLSMSTYTTGGELTETIHYTYNYDPRTRYPRIRTYTMGGKECGDVFFFNYIYPYSLNMFIDR